MLRNAIETNVNLFTRFIMACVPLAGIHHARHVFDHRPHRDDTFLCNSMIRIHMSGRQFAESLTLYNDLRRWTGFIPDNFTFTTLAKSCSSSFAIWEGLELHSHVIKFGFGLDLYVSTALVDMYAKFGKMVWARNVFNEMTDRSLVTWTALISGYARYGDMNNARKLFCEMSENGDAAIYNAMIDGYVKIGDMGAAQSLFDKMPGRNVISWTSMIYGYCTSGNVSSARSLFDSMPDKNLFSWNVMIGGYCQNKRPHEALKLFHELQSSSMFEPDEVTIVSILPAIANMGALDLGEWVHEFVQRKKLDKATNICTALVDMYAKCGEITKARRVFSEMPEKEIASWNALVHGFALNGCAKEALEVFSEMMHNGVKPNDVTMIGVLSACNHGGLVDEARRWFTKMKLFGLTPKIEHYGCIIDLLGRAGCLEEAEKLIESMPYEANGIMLGSFLCACGHSKDIQRAERVLKRVVSMEPWNDGNYVILRNLYATEERWRDAEEIKEMMRRNGVKKEVGCSAVEVDCRVCVFFCGVKEQHPQWGIIESVLAGFLLHMKGHDTVFGAVDV